MKTMEEVRREAHEWAIDYWEEPLLEESEKTDPDLLARAITCGRIGYIAGYLAAIKEEGGWK